MKRNFFLVTAICSLVCFLAANSIVFAPGALGEEGVKTLRCWRCKKAFEVPLAQREGTCPYCGARFILPPPTPVPTPSPIPGTEPDYISWREGPRYVGQTKSVKGEIIGTHLSARSGTLYLNFHPDYNNYLSIKVERQDVGKLPPDPAAYYQGKTVIATGQIKQEKKYLRLIVTGPEDLKVLGDETEAPPAEASEATEPEEEAAAAGEQALTWQEAMGRMGERVVVEARVVKVYQGKSGPVKLNTSSNYKTSLTFVLFNRDGKFGDPNRFSNRMVRVTGTVEEYKGSKQIKVESPADIQIVD